MQQHRGFVRYQTQNLRTSVQLPVSVVQSKDDLDPADYIPTTTPIAFMCA
jgi:hypothetical protein